jgi:hypothetical protein
MKAKFLFLFLSLFCLKTTVIAQSDAESSPWSIGVLAGGKTIKSLFVYDYGISLTKSIAKGHRLGVEVDYRTSGPILNQYWGAYLMKMETNIGSPMGGLNYQWFPWEASSREISSKFLRSLKLKAGAWYINNPIYEFDASLANPVIWGSITFTREEVGSVFTTIKTEKIQPYLGIGYDRFYVGKRLNISLEGGALYQGKPQVSMKASNMLEQSATLAPILQSNLGDYQIIPFLQLQLQIRL